MNYKFKIATCNRIPIPNPIQFSSPYLLRWRAYADFQRTLIQWIFLLTFWQRSLFDLTLRLLSKIDNNIINEQINQQNSNLLYNNNFDSFVFYKFFWNYDSDNVNTNYKLTYCIRVVISWSCIGWTQINFKTVNFSSQ